jgi:hypothetical protein
MIIRSRFASSVSHSDYNIQTESTLAMSALFHLCQPLTPFDNCRTEELKPVAVWIGKKMKNMDWVARHALFRIFIDSKPHEFVVLVAKEFGPDTLLDGMATGSEPAAVIVLPGKPKIQMTLHRYFAQRCD